jgi:hypothetical protein
MRSRFQFNAVGFGNLRTAQEVGIRGGWCGGRTHIARRNQGLRLLSRQFSLDWISTLLSL